MSEEFRRIEAQPKEKELQLKIFNYLRKNPTPKTIQEISAAVNITTEEADKHCQRLEEYAPIKYVRIKTGHWGFVFVDIK
jgi:DNA-binding Lrp family transcriptional regulator